MAIMWCECTRLYVDRLNTQAQVNNDQVLTAELQKLIDERKGYAIALLSEAHKCTALSEEAFLKIIGRKDEEIW